MVDFVSSGGPPLVSIIIPCWNAEAYVGEAIDSALAQTYPNIEVIVIDDGSTDGSLDVIQSFGERIRWETGPNQGACAARNRGIRLAKGEVLQFLDADDWLYIDKVARQVALLWETGVCSVYCDVWMIDSDKPLLPMIYWAHETHSDPVCIALGSNAGTTSGLHRREIVERIGGFDESLPCAQDRDFHLRLAIDSHAVSVISEALVTTWRRKDSVSSDSLRVFTQYEMILLRARELLEKRKGWTEERALAMAKLAARTARIFARNGDLPKAARLWKLARSFHQEGILSVYGPRVRPLVRLFGPALIERALTIFINSTRVADQWKRKN